MIYMVFDEREYLRIVTSEWDAAYCMIDYLVRRDHRPHLEIYDGGNIICLSVGGA